MSDHSFRYRFLEYILKSSNLSCYGTSNTPPENWHAASCKNTFRHPNQLPVLITLCQLSDVIDKQQVRLTTCCWHQMLLVQPLLIVLVATVLQRNHLLAIGI